MTQKQHQHEHHYQQQPSSSQAAGRALRKGQGGHTLSTRDPHLDRALPSKFRSIFLIFCLMDARSSRRHRSSTSTSTTSSSPAAAKQQPGLGRRVKANTHWCTRDPYLDRPLPSKFRSIWASESGIFPYKTPENNLLRQIRKPHF